MEGRNKPQGVHRVFVTENSLNSPEVTGSNVARIKPSFLSFNYKP